MHKSDSDITSTMNQTTRWAVSLPPSEVVSPTSRIPAGTEPHGDNYTLVDGDSSVTASMQELVRFVTVSAMLDDFPEELKSHEKAYNTLIRHNRETYSIFREKNPTYRLIRLLLRQEDQFYLAKLMLWRVYAWGLEIEVQKRLQVNKVKNVKEFYQKWNEVRDDLGEYAVTVTTYGGNFYRNVGKDLEGMQAIWDGGVRLWSEWKCHQPTNLPQTFSDAHNAIASAKIPIYTNGKLSRMLLLGDLVSEGIVVSPTEKELADVIVKANSGAVRRLQLLGFDCRARDEVAGTLQRIRQHLDDGLVEILYGVLFQIRIFTPNFINMPKRPLFVHTPFSTSIQILLHCLPISRDQIYRCCEQHHLHRTFRVPAQASATARIPMEP